MDDFRINNCALVTGQVFMHGHHQRLQSFLRLHGAKGVHFSRCFGTITMLGKPIHNTSKRHVNLLLTTTTIDSPPR